MRYFKNEVDSKALVSEIENVIDSKYDANKDRLATKEDLANLKADQLKWMFLFWVGQLAAMTAIVKLVH